MQTPPIVLIPGLTGTRLQTQQQSNDAYNLWVSVEAMLPSLAADLTSIGGATIPTKVGWGRPEPARQDHPDDFCISPSDWWLDEMQLSADGVTPLRCPTYNQPVQGLPAISVLDTAPWMFEFTWYFYYVIQRLRGAGYGAGKLAAAPYDWRTAPTGLSNRYEYFVHLRDLIVSLYANNGGSPVTIIAHSLGNRVTQYFLEWIKGDRGLGQAWIDEHIGRYVAVSPLWIGGPRAVREALTGGYQFGPLSIRGMKRVIQSYGSVPWMFPITPAQYLYLNTSAFAFLASDTQPLSITEALAQGQATGMAQFLKQYYQDDPNFTDPGCPTGSRAVQTPPVKALDVFYATGQETEIGAYYRPTQDGLAVDDAAASTNPQFKVQNGIRLEVPGKTLQQVDGTYKSGDGTVPYGSLGYFMVWAQQSHVPTITGHEIPGSEHTLVLRDDRFLDQLMQVLGK